MKSPAIKILLFINHIFIILLLGVTAADAPPLSDQNTVPLLLATLLLADITYIASCNVKENSVLFLFCGLLAADSWYLLFDSGTQPADSIFFRVLGPVIMYLSLKFCFLFLFQGYNYKLKKITDILMLLFCISAAAGAFLSDTIYAWAYGIQFTGSILCFAMILLHHRKRVSFVLRSEKRPILFSLLITAAAFGIYYVMTRNIENHIGNFGVYIVVLIFSLSVHGIILKEKNSIPLSAVFSLKQRLLLGAVSLSVLCMVCLAFNSSFTLFILLLNLLLVLIFFCNILLGENLKHKKNIAAAPGRYALALDRLKQEENLKTEFANFLHDEVLQDLLSVKNMTSKSYRPEIQDIMIETLDNLNVRIRNQMQDYHPVILKTLTLKENLISLIESVSAAFPQRSLKVSFDCPDTLFIAEPYDLLVYRLIKELLTNIYKHSDGTHAWITVSSEKDTVNLSVCDNGSGNPLNEKFETNSPLWHKGIFSIKEQISDLNGTMSISDNIPHGVRIDISFLMKGDVSYQYFVS